jgi:hypothetical protein
MRLLELDDLTSSYTNAHPEAGFFVRLPRSSRLQLRCRGRITRHSDKAPIWATRRPFADATAGNAFRYCRISLSLFTYWEEGSPPRPSPARSSAQTDQAFILRS